MWSFNYIKKLSITYLSKIFESAEKINKFWIIWFFKTKIKFKNGNCIVSYKSEICMDASTLTIVACLL